MNANRLPKSGPTRTRTSSPACTRSRRSSGSSRGSPTSTARPSSFRPPAPARPVSPSLFAMPDSGALGQAHPVPVRPPRTPQAGPQRLQGVPARARHRTYVTAATAKDRDKRIYLATYPAMMECFETFDVGLLRPDHRRRIAPQHLQPLSGAVRLLRLPPGRPDGHAGRVHRPQHLRDVPGCEGPRPDSYSLRGRHQQQAALPGAVRGRHAHDAVSPCRASSTRR